MCAHVRARRPGGFGGRHAVSSPRASGARSRETRAPLSRVSPGCVAPRVSAAQLAHPEAQPEPADSRALEVSVRMWYLSCPLTSPPPPPPHTHTGQSASRGCPEAGEERGAGREGDTRGHLTGRKRIIKTDSGTDPGARHVRRVCDTAVARPLPVPMSLRAAALRQTARRLARGKHRAALGTGTDTSSVTGNFWPVVCVSDAGSR